MKHNNLLQQENNLKEKLQNDVTKIKEKLEDYLSELNNQIKINEKIIKAYKNLDKYENNLIATLSYVSKISKSEKKNEKNICSINEKYFFQI